MSTPGYDPYSAPVSGGLVERDMAARGSGDQGSRQRDIYGDTAGIYDEEGRHHVEDDYLGGLYNDGDLEDNISYGELEDRSPTNGVARHNANDYEANASDDVYNYVHGNDDDYVGRDDDDDGDHDDDYTLSRALDDEQSQQDQDDYLAKPDAAADDYYGELSRDDLYGLNDHARAYNTQSDRENSGESPANADDRGASNEHDQEEDLYLAPPAADNHRSESEWSRSDAKSPEWEVHEQQQEEPDSAEGSDEGVQIGQRSRPPSSIYHTKPAPAARHSNEAYQPPLSARGTDAESSHLTSLPTDMSIDFDVLSYAENLHSGTASHRISGSGDVPPVSQVLTTETKRNSIDSLNMSIFEEALRALQSDDEEVSQPLRQELKQTEAATDSYDIPNFGTASASKNDPAETSATSSRSTSSQHPSAIWQPASWLSHAVTLSRNLQQSHREAQSAMTRAVAADSELRRLDLASQAAQKQIAELRKSNVKSRNVANQRVAALRKLVREVRNDPSYVLELQKTISELESYIEQLHATRLQAIRYLRQEESELDAELQTWRSTIAKYVAPQPPQPTKPTPSADAAAPSGVHKAATHHRPSSAKYPSQRAATNSGATQVPRAGTTGVRHGLPSAQEAKSSPASRPQTRLTGARSRLESRKQSDDNDTDDVNKASSDEEDDELDDEFRYLMQLQAEDDSEQHRIQEEEEPSQQSQTSGSSQASPELEAELAEERAMQLELERIQESVGAIDSRLAELTAGLSSELAATGGWDKDDDSRYQAVRARFPPETDITVIYRRLVEDEGLTHISLQELMRHDEWHQEVSNARRAKKILVERYRTLKLDLQQRVARREFEAAERARAAAAAAKREQEKKERAKTLAALNEWRQRKRLLAQAALDAKTSADRARAAVERSVQRAERARLRALVEAHKRAQAALKQEREAEARIKAEAEQRAKMERQREMQRKLNEQLQRDLQQRAQLAQARAREEELARAHAEELKSRAASRYEGVVTRDPSRIYSATHAAQARAREVRRELEEHQLEVFERARTGTKPTLLDRPQTGRVAVASWRKGL